METPCESPFRNKWHSSTAALRRLTNLKRTTTESFRLLECDFTLNIKKVKSAYRKMALKLHPDKPTNDTKQFKKLGHAVERLVANVNTLLAVHLELSP